MLVNIDPTKKGIILYIFNSQNKNLTELYFHSKTFPSVKNVYSGINQLSARRGGGVPRPLKPFFLCVFTKLTSRSWCHLINSINYNLHLSKSEYNNEALYNFWCMKTEERGKLNVKPILAVTWNFDLQRIFPPSIQLCQKCALLFPQKGATDDRKRDVHQK